MKNEHKKAIHSKKAQEKPNETSDESSEEESEEESEEAEDRAPVINVIEQMNTFYED